MLIRKKPKLTREQALSLVDNAGTHILGMPDFWGDKKVMLHACKSFPEAFQTATEELRDDKDFVLTMIHQCRGDLIRFVSDRLRNDREVMIESAKRGGNPLEYCTHQTRRNKELLLELLEILNDQGSFMGLTYVPDELCTDRDFVSRAASFAGWIIDHASDEIKRDEEIAMKAVMSVPQCIIALPDCIKSNKKIVMEAVKREGSLLEFMPDAIKDDDEIAFAAVGNDGFAYRGLSTRLKHNRELAKLALREHAGALCYMPDEFRDDDELIAMAVRNFGTNIALASDRLRNDKAIVNSAMSDNEYRCGSNIFPYISDEMRRDEKVARESAALLDEMGKNWMPF